MYYHRYTNTTWLITSWRPCQHFSSPWRWNGTRNECDHLYRYRDWAPVSPPNRPHCTAAVAWPYNTILYHLRWLDHSARWGESENIPDCFLQIQWNIICVRSVLDTCRVWSSVCRAPVCLLIALFLSHIIY